MSSRRKVNGESSSASGNRAGGGFLSRWRMRRAQKKIWAEIVTALEEHLASGAPIEDFLVFCLDEKVEWDVSLQSWIIRVYSDTLGDLVMEPGNRVRFDYGNGRGGATEDARIEEVIGDFVDAKSGKSGIIYSLRFEPLEKTSE